MAVRMHQVAFSSFESQCFPDASFEFKCYLTIFGNDVFSKHLFPMVSYTQNTHKIPISSNPRSTLLPSPLPIPLQPV